jgi:hypothetical protein
MAKNRVIAFINFINSNSNYGEKIISIAQQKNAKNFSIQPVYKNKKIIAINVEKYVMPLDTIFPIKIFEEVLKRFTKKNNYILLRGNALQNRLGSTGLSVDSIEGFIAKQFYQKRDNQSVDRRVSVIANILVASGLCKHGRGCLELPIDYQS